MSNLSSPEGRRSSRGEEHSAKSHATSPHHLVLGASDLDATAAFFGALGFERASGSDVTAPTMPDAAAALYGLTNQVRQVVLVATGHARGGIRLIGTGPAKPSTDPFRLGFHAIDIYTTDIDRSVSAAVEAGGRLIGGPATFDTGAAELTGAMVHGPDGVPVVFLQNAHRYPSALDGDQNRLNSEVHSLVWAVADIKLSSAFWTESGGLLARGPFDFADPGASSFMGLPGPARMAMSVLADESSQPPRLELLEFIEDRREQVAGRTLMAGQAWPVFVTRDLRATIASMSAVDWGSPVEPDGAGWACTGLAPGGVVIELRESHA